MQRIQAYNAAINFQIIGQILKDRDGEKLFFVGHRAQHISYAELIADLDLSKIPHLSDYVIPFFVDDSIVRDEILVFRFMLHPHGVEHVAIISQLAIPMGFTENT